MTSSLGGVSKSLTRGDFKERKTGKLAEKDDKGGGGKMAQKKMTSFVNAPLERYPREAVLCQFAT